MPLPVFATIDEVPDAFRDEYEERDGAFHPKVPDVTKLNSALDKERSRASDNEKARKKAEADLAELLRSQAARESGVSEEALKKIREDEAAARKPIEEEREVLRAENRKLRLTDRVQALYLANGGMSDRIEDAMLVLDRRTDLGDAGGIVFKDKDGNMTADSAETFFKKLTTEKSWLFAGSGASGSGARGSSATEMPADTKATVTEAKRQQVANAF